jgi:phage repressor protein C with HTH and peptisase S24 domain
METMGARLRAARKAARFSSARAAALKYHWTPSTYAAHENGQNDFDPDIAGTYGKAFRVDPGWLLTGHGVGPKPPIISSFDPDAVDPAAEADMNSGPSGVIASIPQGGTAELASGAELGAGLVIETSYRREGTGHTVVDAIKDDYWHLPPHFVRAVGAPNIASLLVIECLGDSMEPTFKSGDRVIVDTSYQVPSPDGLYAIRDAFDVQVVKRLTLIDPDKKIIQVGSDNPLHPSFDRPLDQISVVGKVVAGVKRY